MEFGIIALSIHFFWHFMKMSILIILSPPSKYELVTHFLLILSGLLSHREEYRRVFNCLTSWVFGVGREVKIWLKLDKIKVLITVIFTRGVNFLLFHWFKVCSPLVSMGEKFRAVIFSKSTEKWIPNKSNLVAPHTKLSFVLYISNDRLFFPQPFSFILINH